MADASQIEQAIVEALSAAIFPTGTYAPASTVFPLMLVRGWPTEASLADAKKAGGGLIAVHQKTGFARSATRYARDWHTLTQAAATITATLTANVVTLGGTVTAGDIVAVLSGGAAYTHVAAAGDTLATIAAALAAQIAGASASGAVLTLPATGPLPAVGVFSSGVAAMEVARQQAGFSVHCFAPSPANRDTLFGVIFPTAATIDPVTLPDGTVARQLTQQESGPDDMPMRIGMWKREIMLVFDYPVMFTAAQAAAAAILQSVTINGTSTTDFATV
ncbi:hypothetical protein [Acidiphilium sp.]|uniref:hypothetical protein n=1 Tax=Acidiphilium sp. TaxID=527 RepID=UPI002CC4BA47|nr:hypothetical protein [Acidiphilium sp.]HQT62547.1 hypothetical protein [Acidiphilium sp.]